jgi:hypothetical protein
LRDLSSGLIATVIVVGALMNTKLLGILGAVGLFSAFAVFVGVQLVKHGGECDSALRHCPVPFETVRYLEGSWCNAEALGRVAPLRKTFTRTNERLRFTLATPGTAQPPVPSDARFFLENGVVLLFAYDPVTGAQHVGRIMLRRVAEDRIETQVQNVRIPWLRCDRLRENGVPASVQAIFAGA